MSTPLNYETLRQALDRTLKDVDQWRITADQIDIDEDVELGHGGYSTVYAATFSDRSGSVSNVAVKVLRAGLEKKDIIHLAVALARELRVWATLDHPHVLPLLGFRLDMGQDSAWIVSPRMFDGNIRDFFAKIKPDFERRLQAAREMTEALIYLHGRDPPVCHGDLKPDNLLINHAGQVALSDFGLTVIPDTSRSGLTTTRSLVGTIRYLAPELMEADEPARTLKSDIWAYGCVVSELLTDELPYSRCPTDFHVTGEIMKGSRPMPLEDPRLPRRLLTSAWAIEATARPHVHQCLDVLSSPLSYIPISNGTAYNDRDFEAGSYTGEVFHMFGNHTCNGWVATSSHRSCRLSPVAMEGLLKTITDLSALDAQKIVLSDDGLSLAFHYLHDKTGLPPKVVVYNTVTKEHESLSPDHPSESPYRIGAEIVFTTACSGDFQLFGYIFCKTFSRGFELRVWHMTSKTYVFKFPLEGKMWKSPPQSLCLLREGLCILVGVGGAASCAYGDGVDPRISVVHWVSELPEYRYPIVQFTSDKTYFAIMAHYANVQGRHETDILFFETEALRQVGVLKIIGFRIKDFTLAGDGKSAVLVEENPGQRPQRPELFYCDLSTVLFHRTSDGSVQCPIRPIASRVTATGAIDEPIIRMSSDGTWAVAVHPGARTVLDLQTGLILREFSVDSDPSKVEIHMFKDLDLPIDSLPILGDADAWFKYDVDPPCPLDAEECRYHKWTPISWASAEFTYTEVPEATV